MNARTNLTPRVSHTRQVVVLEADAANDAVTLREKLREDTELDAVQSGKQERDQMRSELWGDV